MHNRSMHLRLLAVMCLAGCSVADQPYPTTWGPLPRPVPERCANFQGSYADRGESSGTQAEPSLSRGLFGTHSAWKQVKRVEFRLPDEGVLAVTAWDDVRPLIERSFTTEAGDFACDSGKLVVRSKRWVAEDIISGRQRITIEFAEGKSQLVAHVKESTYGTIFAVVPIAGTAARWYRFPRLTR